jgi:hypothetical protein
VFPVPMSRAVWEVWLFLSKSRVLRWGFGIQQQGTPLPRHIRDPHRGSIVSTRHISDWAFFQAALQVARIRSRATSHIGGR